MAQVTKTIAKPVAVKPVVKVATPTKVVAKQPAKPISKEFEIVSMDGIQLAPKAGGGRGLSELAAKTFSLEIGQGFKISDDTYGVSGKGVASLYAGAKRREIKLRVRRDLNGQLWMFRVEMPETETPVVEKESAPLNPEDEPPHNAA